jgi:predicted TIM-barrel fold metal-dependent hydrolase
MQGTRPGSGEIVSIGDQLPAPFSSGVLPPRTPVPPGAVDCHHHIVDPRFPGDRPLPPATVGDYRLFQRRLGLTRSVVVAPSTHGDDNRGLVDALGELGTDRARGVALVHPEVGDAELRHLHRNGVRGVRVYLGKGRVPTPEELRTLSRRAAGLGWSVSVVATRDRDLIADWEDTLATLACPVVVDHLGWAPQPAGVDSATAAALGRLLEAGNTYVKLSGLYLSSRVGHPSYSDVDALAGRLCRTAPQRVLWGTDWPHLVALAMGQPAPDGALLFDKLADWLPDANDRRRVLVDNPERLYWRD